MTATNLPLRTDTTNDDSIRLFFDNFGINPTELNSQDFNTIFSFFIKRGFEQSAALNVSALILKQARFDNVSIFEILDKIDKFDQVEISVLVAQLLNKNRVPTSVLGFKLRSSSTDQGIVP
jgi:hypothetical protein